MLTIFILTRYRMILNNTKCIKYIIFFYLHLKHQNNEYENYKNNVKITPDY